MNFEIFGPFTIPRADGLIDDSATARKDFWAMVDQKVPKLSEACGCYIFVGKGKKGALPWYVGLTTKRAFRVEALGLHQVNHYNKALAKKIGVLPQLFFLAKTTPTDRFARPSANSHADIEFLETLLFGVALNRNPKLRNAKNTKYLKGLVVPGILNSPQRPPKVPERRLKGVLGL